MDRRIAQSPLWVITSYFNPLGYRRRRSNYREFRQRLGAPLIAVEHAYDGRFELAPGDADILLRCAGGGVMWQKERLLNLAVQSLPAACRSVAWVDCDVVFGDERWDRRLVRALDRVPLVQPFGVAHYLDFDARLSRGRPAASYTRPAAAQQIAAGLPPEHCLGSYRGPEAGARAAGLAWACRREILEQHGLYDACIIGGGGLAVVAAAYGLPEIVVANHQMNAAQASFFRRWANEFHAAIRGQVGYLPGDLWHLWHGDPRDRQTNQRHRGLVRFAFDPARDIALSPGGCWEWNSDKPELHDYVRQFFAARREDAAPPRRARAPAARLLPTWQPAVA